MQRRRRFNTLPTIDNIIAKEKVNSILRREWRERIKNCLYEVTKTWFDAQNLDPIIDIAISLVSLYRCITHSTLITTRI